MKGWGGKRQGAGRPKGKAVKGVCVKPMVIAAYCDICGKVVERLDKPHKYSSWIENARACPECKSTTHAVLD